MTHEQAKTKFLRRNHQFLQLQLAAPEASILLPPAPGMFSALFSPFVNSPLLAMAGLHGIMCVCMGFRMGLFHSATMAGNKVDELHRARVSAAQRNNAERSPYIMVLQIGIHLASKTAGVPLHTISLCGGTGGVGATATSFFYILGNVVYTGNWKTADVKAGYKPPFFKGIGAMGRYLAVLVMCLELFRYC